LVDQTNEKRRWWFESWKT